VVGSANAFTLGCQKVNPECQVRLIITNDYFNPPAAVQASNTLVNAGADILHGWTDDPGFCEVAERRGVRVIGQFLDYRDVCPKAFITSTLWGYAPFYLDQVDQMVEGTWKGHQIGWRKVGDGADLAEWGEDVPDSVKEAVATETEAIKAGESPFVGPIYDNKGKLRVKEGETLGPDYLYSKWTWLVKGVVS
jgi:basic membrane lipoprotein Med (substrate-binding protein (PBP1-ABC) superfamily)